MPTKKLSVNNKVFKYKDTFYQISQIASVKVVAIKKVREINLISLKPIKFTFPATFISFFLAELFITSEKEMIIGIVFFIFGFLLSVYTFFIIKKWITDKRQDKFNKTYGVSLRMSGGDSPIFISTNKSLMYEIRDAIINAMNQGEDRQIINIEDVKIEVYDSEYVEIATIK